VNLKFMLDTNVVSDAILPQPRPGVLRGIQRHSGEIAIASVVWHELRFGIERLQPSHRRDDLETYLADISGGMPILDYTSAAAEWHARERARLMARGQTPPILDGQIAAIAAVNNLTLVTFNARDFNRFEGLRVESWF
jgi:tRNA(fMet)-specific endonuclease VapC